jgi:hypothetical protein
MGNNVPKFKNPCFPENCVNDGVFGWVKNLKLAHI